MSTKEISTYIGVHPQQQSEGVHMKSFQIEKRSCEKEGRGVPGGKLEEEEKSKNTRDICSILRFFSHEYFPLSQIFFSQIFSLSHKYRMQIAMCALTAPFKKTLIIQGVCMDGYREQGEMA